MRIALCTFYPVFSGTGGAEKVFWLMANEFANRGHEVTAIGFEKTYMNPFFEVRKDVCCVNVGIDYHKSVFVNIKSIFQFGDEKRRSYRDFKEGVRKGQRILPVLQKINPDVIISYQIEMTYVLTEILKVSCPVITMCHNTIDVLLEGKKRFYEALEKCDCIQVLLPSYSLKMKSYLAPKRVEYIPNIVPQYEEEPKYESHVIINVGRVDREQKQQHLLIQAFAQAHKKHPSWCLEFWGDTTYDEEYFRECCRLVEVYNLKDKVKFCGVTKNVVEQLKRGSIFAFPSAFEGFPLALTEAMSMGLPTIGYKTCPGSNELIIDGKNGFLVDDGVDSLAEAMAILMENKDLRVKLGKHAKMDMKQFAPKIIWDKWEQLINDVVNIKVIV